MVPADKAGDGSMASSLRNACKNWKCISYSAQMNGALDKMILNKVDVLGLLCIANTLEMLRALLALFKLPSCEILQMQIERQ